MWTSERVELTDRDLRSAINRVLWVDLSVARVTCVSRALRLLTLGRLTLLLPDALQTVPNKGTLLLCFKGTEDDILVVFGIEPVASEVMIM